MDIFAFYADDFKVYQAVGQEDMVTGFNVLRQLFIVHRSDGFVAYYVTSGQRKIIAGFHHDRAVFEFAQPNFRSFRVEEQSYGDT